MRKPSATASSTSVSSAAAMLAQTTNGHRLFFGFDGTTSARHGWKHSRFTPATMKAVRTAFGQRPRASSPRGLFCCCRLGRSLPPGLQRQLQCWRLATGHHAFVIPGRSRSKATSRRPWDPCRDISRRMQRPKMALVSATVPATFNHDRLCLHDREPEAWHDLYRRHQRSRPPHAGAQFRPRLALHQPLRCAASGLVRGAFRHS
jgi:hypothetical protein